jgi:hypothetical protein
MTGTPAGSRARRPRTAEGDDLLVVTADRGLRARLPAGVPVIGPRTLLTALPE